SLVQPRTEPEDIVCLGRQTWREVLNGLDEGCRRGLTDEIVENNLRSSEETEMTESGSNHKSDDKEKGKSTPTPDLTQYTPIVDETSLPPSFATLGYIPHHNLVGWSKVPYRLYLWLNDYIRVQNVGEHMVHIALGKTRTFKHGEDENIGIDERALWTTAAGK